jgi:foldase protein PrsA
MPPPHTFRVQEFFNVSRKFSAIFVALLALQACHSEAPPAVEPAQPVTSAFDDEVVATVRGDRITRKDLEPVLEEGYGLNVLLTLVQRDLVEQEAAKQGVVVTPADVINERTITMKNLVRQTEALDSSGQPTTEPTDNLSTDQQNQLLDQLLQQQHVSRAEFNVILEVNAYLRKLAEPKIIAKLTDDAVRQQFNVMYGEKVLVHYIVCNNMAEASEVHHDLAAGKSFDDVARARSLDRRTAYTGGELPAFTLQDNRFPPEFKQVAFELKKGEVSDPVQVEKFIYIIKLIDRIPPAHARFEDYRDSVKKELYESTVQAAMKVMRDNLGRMALDSLTIRDPILEKQWADKMNQKNGQVKDSEELRKELDSQHAPATIPSTTGQDHPPAAPATSPAPDAAR